MTAAKRTTTLQSRPADRGVRRATRSGFSLFELLIAMSVMGIIAAVAVPRYANSVGRYRAESAARRVAADLTLAQAKARAASSVQFVNFNKAAGSYTIAGVADLDHPKSLYTVNLAGEPYHVTIGYADFGGTPQAQFDMFGNAAFGGSVTVNSGSYSSTVLLIKQDGTVSVP
jgi:prepilin-type N-terminal cleavage/methylation domain-containing protein